MKVNFQFNFYNPDVKNQNAAIFEPEPENVSNFVMK